jgi:hypothetical protein
VWAAAEKPEANTYPWLMLLTKDSFVEIIETEFCCKLLLFNYL